MRILLSRATQADPNFAIGLSLVLLLAIAEISAATFYYVNRMRALRTPGQSVATLSTRRPPLFSGIAPSHLQPSPATPASSPALSAIDRLLQEAIELRDRGDTTTALARLHEASEREPNNAMVLEETAKTYEAMQLFDRSNEAWRKLRDLGPAIGPLYELADRRLKVGVPQPDAASAAVAPESFGDIPARNQIGGIPEDSTFGISEISATQTQDPDAETNLTLRIGIKKQPTAQIDHTKVKIQVFFYDTVDNQDIRLTDADVNYEWLTSKHDWSETNPEILSVTYLRPKTRGTPSEAALSETAAAVKPNQKARAAKGTSAGDGGRKYLGYRVLVYYDDKLQAVQAEPTRLLQLFPASESISSP